MTNKVKWVGTLSTTERNHIGLIRVRQNNQNSEIFGFEIIDGNGEPYDLKNRKVLFCTYFDKFAPVEQYAEVIENGKIVYTMNQHDMQKPVRINFAYFKILDDKDNLVDTTQNFSYDIMPSIESKCMNSEPYIIRLEEMLDVFANVRDESTKELEKIIADFNDRVVKQQEDFDKWFDSIRDILESIDPNGKMLAEVIGGRYSIIADKEFQTLAERNEFTDNKILEVERKTTSNDWLKTLNGSYIAHKGFTGMKFDGPIQEHVYPDNTIKSFEMAGNLGYKAIEIDVVKCLDAFVITHEEDTTLLSGEYKQLKDMTLSEIKERTISRQYIGGGNYVELEGVDSNYKVPTLKEVFDLAKRFDMYVICDMKWMQGYSYTDNDITEVVEITRETGMEKYTFWYGNSNFKICDILEDSILAISSINESNVESTVEHIKKYNNYTFSVSDKDFYKYLNYSKNYNIPLLIWTVDEYYIADNLFSEGANCILTNRLLYKANIKDLKSVVVDVDKLFVNNGPGNHTYKDGVHRFETTTYLTRYLGIGKNILNKGDIIKVTASGRTVSSELGGFCRINIDNSLNGNKLLKSLAFFKKNSFEEKEVYYIVNKPEDVIAIHFGMGSGGFSGSGVGEIKDITVEVLTNEELEADAFGLIFCYNGNIGLRNKFVSNGINYVKKNTLDKSLLEIGFNLKRLHNLKPVVLSSLDAYSTQFTYKVIPQNIDIETGVLKVKFLDSNNQIVKDVDTLQLAFSILIK